MSLPPKGSFNSFISTTTPTSPTVLGSSKLILKGSVRNISNLILPSITQPESKLHNESLVKTQFQLQLGKNHRILRSIFASDKEEASHRDNTSLNHSFKRISAGFKLIQNQDKDKLNFFHKLMII